MTGDDTNTDTYVNTVGFTKTNFWTARVRSIQINTSIQLYKIYRYTHTIIPNIRLTQIEVYFVHISNIILNIIWYTEDMHRCAKAACSNRSPATTFSIFISALSIIHSLPINNHNKRAGRSLQLLITIVGARTDWRWEIVSRRSVWRKIH